MKKIFNIRFKHRKRGNSILEFIAILPVFIMMGWSMMQIMFFLLSQSTAHEAAMETARIISMDMRGNTNELHNLSDAEQETMKQKVYLHTLEISKFNGLFLLLRNDSGTVVSETEAVTNIITFGTKATCDSQMETKKRVICVYTNKGAVAGSSIVQEQIVVKAKGPFKVNGSFVNLKDRFFARSTGVSQKELAGRFQYVE